MINTFPGRTAEMTVVHGSSENPPDYVPYSVPTEGHTVRDAPRTVYCNCDDVIPLRRGRNQYRER